MASYLLRSERGRGGRGEGEREGEGERGRGGEGEQTQKEKWILVHQEKEADLLCGVGLEGLADGDKIL